MRILGLDIEGSYGIMSPHEDGFYTSCVGLLMLDDDGVPIQEDVVWIDHEEVRRTVNGIVQIQLAVDSSDLIIGQNLKYDIKALMYYGVDFSKAVVWDTMVAEWFIRGCDQRTAMGLNAIAARYGVEGKGEEGDAVKSYWNDGVDTRFIPHGILSLYQIKDCHIPITVYHKQLALCEEWGMLKSIQLQQEWLLSLCEMEYNGIDFDDTLARSIVKEYKGLADEINDWFQKELNEPRLNIGSDIQKSVVVFGGELRTTWTDWTMLTYKTKPETKYYEKTFKDRHDIKGLGFPSPTNKKFMGKKGFWKCDAKIVQALPAKNAKHRECKDKLLKFAKYTKIHQTLIGKSYKTGLCRKLSPAGRIHPTLEQVWARTGRLSSRNPNGQNLFPIIKVCFKPSLDFIGQIDLSQVEWRTAMELSHDQVGIDEVNNGVDQHAATAKELMEVKFTGKHDKESYENRQHAKVFNFRMIFGGTAYGFINDVNMPDFGKAKFEKIIKKFWNKYIKLDHFHGRNIKRVREEGELSSITGKRYVFDKSLNARTNEMEYVPNSIRNRIIQGTAAELMALTGAVIRRGMIAGDMESKMILTVHDSIVFDIKKGEEDRIKNLSLAVTNGLREYVQGYFGLPWRTYLEGEFEIGPDYGTLTEVKLDEKCIDVMQREGLNV